MNLITKFRIFPLYFFEYTPRDGKCLVSTKIHPSVYNSRILRKFASWKISSWN